MEEAFEKVVQHIFNNWSALKLAVEHSMGGPHSKQTAVDCMNYMTQYCLYEANVQTDDIQEALEDILDEEFDLICEDNSPKEIAALLFKFVQLLKEGNTAQCEIEYQNLPTSKEEWLTISKEQSSKQVPVTEESSDEEDKPSTSQSPMEEDSEWTQVKTRRKR